MCYEGVREAQGSQTRYPFGMDETRYNAVINHVNRAYLKNYRRKISLSKNQWFKLLKLFLFGNF